MKRKTGSAEGMCQGPLAELGGMLGQKRGAQKCGRERRNGAEPQNRELTGRGKTTTADVARFAPASHKPRGTDRK